MDKEKQIEEMADKIKAIQPQITVNSNIEKPYYSITYYDTEDKEWHVGYGSYSLANVVKWLEEEFEVVAEVADVVKHGYWKKRTAYPMGYYCSECNNFETYQSSFCRCCGAKMKGGAK